MSWLDDLLPHLVSIRRVSGLGSSGDRTYGSPTIVSARVEPTSTVTRSMDGEEVVVTHKIALLTPIAVHDLITLSDGSERRVHAVSSAEELDAGQTLLVAEVS